jgi:hypothetical protein
LLERQTLLLVEMFYFHVLGLIALHSHCQITSVEFSPLRPRPRNP